MAKTKTAYLLIILLIGLIFGGIIGELLKNVFPLISYGKSIGFDTVTINLGIIKLILGLDISINLASILGLLLALIVFSKVRV